MQSAVKDGEFAVLSPIVQLAIFLQTYLFANTAKPTAAYLALAADMQPPAATTSSLYIRAASII